MRGLSVQRVRWGMTGLVLLAFALRLYRLEVPSLRGDEAFSVTFSRHSLGEMFRLFTASTEPHPPLSFVVLHYWQKLVGEGEFALRLTSVWAGVLIVPLIYVLGHLLWDCRVGTIAAALVSVNPFYIWHAQEARMYAMLVAFSVASTILFWRLLHEAGWRWPVWYGLVTALSIYTHYYTFLLLAFHGVYVVFRVLVEGWRNRSLISPSSHLPFIRWSVGAFLAGALYLPWLAASWTVLGAYQGGARSSLPFWAPVYRSLLAFGQGQTLSSGLALWFLPLWVGLFLGGIGVAWWRDQRSAWFLLLYFVIPWGIVFVDSLRRPAFDERYFMVSSPPFYLFAALALRTLYCRWRMVAAVAGMLILGISGISLYNHYYDPAFARAPDWRALNAFFVERVRPGDVVIANYPDPAASYYYRFNVPWTVLPEAYPVDREATTGALDDLLRTCGRIWLTPQQWTFWDADGMVEAELDTRAERVAEYQVDRFRVLLYHTPSRFAAEMNPLDARFEGGIRLLGYAMRDEEGQAVDRLEVGPGASIRLTLYWQAESKIEADYVVFAHALDQTGRLRGQQDNQPRGGTFPTRAWKPGEWVVDIYHFSLSADAPPGEYLLEVGMYRPPEGIRLQANGSDVDAANRRIVLRGLVVVP